MNSYAVPLPSNRSRNVAAILLAAIIAGSLDLTFAFTFHGIMSHVWPTRILLSIATGWFGANAMQGGAGIAAIGFFSHYGILLGAAAIYFCATRVMPWMMRHAYLYGVVFGVCIYGVMHLVVLPLSNAPAFKGTTVGTVADFAMHALVIGPAIALTLKRFSRSV
jgi:hypothetical protein